MTARIALLTALVALGRAAPARAVDFSRPGRFAVGVTVRTFQKTSVTTGAPRPLATVVWYPAAARRTAGVAEIPDAPVRRGRRPLLVFSHGSCGLPTESTYLTRALASRGFVVAAPPHPGNTADDFPGCAVPADFIDSFLNRVPDVRFVVDAMQAEASDPTSPFFERLRTDAVGIAGLSFGGYTTLAAAQQEPRLRAALALVPGGSEVLGPEDVAIPAMVIGAERDAVVGFAQSEAAFARLAGPRFLVKLLAANHVSVVDDCAPVCVPGDIAQEDAHRLVLRYAVPFLRRYLAGRGGGGRVLARPVEGVELRAEPR